MAAPVRLRGLLRRGRTGCGDVHRELTRSFFAAAIAMSIGCAAAPAFLCKDRVGACFNAKLNGVMVAPIADRVALDAFLSTPDPTLRHDLEQVKWTMTGPAGRKLDVRTATLPDGLAWFGAGETAIEVKIVPLTGQVPVARKRAKAPGSVRSGGTPVVTAADDLTQDILPAGVYLVIVTLRTERNWDRKYILATLS